MVQELNIGGSLVTSALEEACGTTRSKVREMYNDLGDLGRNLSLFKISLFIVVKLFHCLSISLLCLKGDVAQACRQTQTLLAPPSPLLIKDVFSTLRKIR